MYLIVLGAQRCCATLETIKTCHLFRGVYASQLSTQKVGQLKESITSASKSSIFSNSLECLQKQLLYSWHVPMTYLCKKAREDTEYYVLNRDLFLKILSQQLSFRTSMEALSLSNKVSYMAITQYLKIYPRVLFASTTPSGMLSLSQRVIDSNTAEQ